MLERASTGFDKLSNIMRILFFDFSIVLNTVQLQLLQENVKVMQVKDTVVARMTDHLSNWPQSISATSYLKWCWETQGATRDSTVILSTLYTTYFRCISGSCHVAGHISEGFSTDFWQRVLLGGEGRATCSTMSENQSSWTSGGVWNH